MRILLVAPSYFPQVNTSYFPLGLSYVGSYAKARGYCVDGLNLNHYPDPERYELLQQQLRSGGYDIVGITGLTVCFNEMDKLVNLIRKVDAKLPIVLGGGITSCEARLVMEVIKPDYMVTNEGEITFVKLLEAIKDRSSLSEVRGIWFWMDGKPVYTGEGLSVDDLNTLEEPDLDMMGIEKHISLQEDCKVSYHLTRYDMGKSIPVLASRSCPFKCTFCHHAGMGRYKTHDIHLVVAQIERYVNKYGVNCVSIYDELFSANRERLQQFCQLLLEKKLNIKWFCQLRVDQLDQDSLNLMKRAGCNYISFGFESGSDTILASMRKKIKAADIAKAVVMSRKAKIGFQANLLFGDPAESLTTLQETLRFQLENELYFTDWSAVIPYAGTQIFDYAWENGLIRDKEQFIRSQCDIANYLYKHQINMTTMTDAEYHEWYIKLREINDLNHRKRLALVKEGVQTGKWQSDLAIECPTCRHQLKANLRYPLEAQADGTVNLDSPVGMQGINILCPECCRKMHLMPKEIPHIKLIFARFQESVDRLKESGREVVVLPAMDRYLSVFMEDILMEGLNVTAVLDSRHFRVGEIFLDRKVELFDKTAILKHRDAFFLVLPWVEHRKALDILAEVSVPVERILSWNKSFTSADYT